MRFSTAAITNCSASKQLSGIRWGLPSAPSPRNHIIGYRKTIGFSLYLLHAILLFRLGELLR